MSILLRLVRSHRIKNRLMFLKPNEIKIYNRIYRSDLPIQKTEKEDLYEIKNAWGSYGFDHENKEADRQAMHITFFTCISVVLVFGTLIIAYAPDPLLKDWAQREAYLQLRYREENGLPLIDPNLIDPSKFTLPSEEEIVDVEIII